MSYTSRIGKRDTASVKEQPKASHTPGLWDIIEGKTTKHGTELEIVPNDGSGTVIARTFDETHAKLIVTACNCYDELLGALQRIANNASLRKWNTNNNIDADIFAAIEREARATITKATGGGQ